MDGFNRVGSGSEKVESKSNDQKLLLTRSVNLNPPPRRYFVLKLSFLILFEYNTSTHMLNIFFSAL